jgi:hypothetical protein
VGIAAGEAEGLHATQFTTTAKGEDQKVAGISGGAVLTREREGNFVEEDNGEREGYCPTDTLLAQ